MAQKSHIAINTLHTDLFGDELIKEGHLWDERAESRVPHLISVMAHAALKVLKRQYKSYLDMGDSEIEQYKTDTG